MPAELYGPAGALAALAFMVIGFLRGDIVPRYIYERERDQRTKAEVQAERNTEALEAVAATVKAALDVRRDG